MIDRKAQLHEAFDHLPSDETGATVAELIIKMADVQYEDMIKELPHGDIVALYEILEMYLDREPSQR